MHSLTLTVVVISHGDLRALTTSLRTLRQQSLSRLDFQVLLLRYETADRGPETRDALREIMLIDLDEELSEQANLKRAPHDFLFLTALSEYITFLSEGDSLSSYFLEAMVNAAEDNVVPLSQIVEVFPSGRHVKSPRNGSELWKSKHALLLSDYPAAFLWEPVGKLFQRDAITEKHIEHIREAD